MVDFPIPVQEATDFGRAPGVVEKCFRRMGLVQGMKTTSRKHPGSTHWHYKRAAQSGTIEITVWPAERRIWITVQDGRKAEWITEMLPELTRELKQALRSKGKAS